MAPLCFDSLERWLSGYLTSQGLWDKLLMWDEREYVMTCCTSGHDKWSDKGGKKGGGIVDGHAYTMIGVREVKSIKLVNVRNPWGSFEWTGAWSDNASEWKKNPDVKKAINPKFGNDGSFWMAYADWLKAFSGVEVCAVRRQTEKKWFESRLPSEFEDGNWASLSQPYPSRMFVVTLTKPDEIFIGLHQEDERMEGAPPHLHIGLNIYTMDGRKVLAKKQGIGRCVQVDHLKLDKGSFLLRLTAYGYYTSKAQKGSERVLFPGPPEDLPKQLPRHFVLVGHADSKIILRDATVAESPWKPRK
ncbi:hypothetical protein CYMTET_51910 [Cymbomonas tetramitiformis]|uniref:Calpain catalytic domain-containing protein n=1 Tax=Cymbomonas tetramitiformis TaxID=36881 RepID=A0AAE0BKA5_9CHLO|nr:hypothetical protein CYMTET_51910 [Cymbomonas tetramitiformis]